MVCLFSGVLLLVSRTIHDILCLFFIFLSVYSFLWHFQAIRVTQHDRCGNVPKKAPSGTIKHHGFSTASTGQAMQSEHGRLVAQAGFFHKIGGFFST